MNFLQKIYKKSKEQKGFTLVEMIVVLVIIAILAAITIPALLKYIDKAREKQIVIDARTAYLAAETTLSEAYAQNKLPKSGSIIFGTDSVSDASEANDKDFQKNAKELTGINKPYKCKVSFDSDRKSMTTIQFQEGDTIATMNVGSDSSWDLVPTSGSGIS